MHDLSPALDRLRAGVADPRLGLFGPESAVWEINRHSVVFLGAGRAALLQIAHPFVAHAIEQHSDTFEDPVGRFHRTFLQVFDMVYGDLDAAIRAARRVHAIHGRIHGRMAEATPAFAARAAYTARDVDALLWVHATLWDTSVQVYELVHGPLAAAKRDAYVRETSRFAALFGVPGERLPRSWSEFESYNREMWEGDVLTVVRPGRQIAEFLFRPLAPGTGPLMRAYRELTAALLPAPLRRGFGLPDARLDRGKPRLLLAAARLAARRSTRGLRYLPPYHEALERTTGRRQPPLASLFRRLLLGPPPGGGARSRRAAGAPGSS